MIIIIILKSPVQRLMVPIIMYITSGSLTSLFNAIVSRRNDVNSFSTVLLESNGAPVLVSFCRDCVAHELNMLSKRDCKPIGTCSIVRLFGKRKLKRNK